MSRIISFFNFSTISLGRWVLESIEYAFNILGMTYLSLRAPIMDRAQGMRSIFSVVSAQIYFTGWQAFPLVSVLALASGCFVIIPSTTQLSFFGGSEMIGNLMIAIIVRELGPLFVAMIVTARSGTAVASELGNMKANREIEALAAVGISPLSYIVFPRIIGGTISTLCLGFYFDIVALLGGFLATRLLHQMPVSYYTESISQALTAGDLMLLLLKNSFSGAIIFVISSYQGLLVQRSPHEVPQVTTKAVLNSIIYVVAFNVIVSGFFYLNQLMQLGVI